MRKLSRITGVAALLLTAAFARAGEAPMVEGVDGRPENFEKGDRACFAVWHVKDTNRWHVTVTTAGKKHHFKGTIKVEGGGHFTDIDQWKGSGEKKAEKDEGNWFHKDIKKDKPEKPTEISFDIFSEDKHESGIIFDVDGKGPVHWNLGIGGADKKDEVKHEPAHVKIGKKGENPPEMPFKTWAHPDTKAKGR